MIKNSEKGIALIMVFLMMTIMAAMVFSINAILLKKVGLLGDMGKSAEALSIAKVGEDKILYYNLNEGICKIDKNCPTSVQNPTGGLTNCDDVTMTSTASGGCGNCNNCQVTLKSTENGKINTVSATITDCATLAITSIGSTADGTTWKTEKIYGAGDSGTKPVFLVCAQAPPL